MQASKDQRTSRSGAIIRELAALPTTLRTMSQAEYDAAIRAARPVSLAEDFKAHAAQYRLRQPKNNNSGAAALSVFLLASAVTVFGVAFSQREELLSRGAQIVQQSEEQKVALSSASWENLDALKDSEIYLRGIVLQKETVRVGTAKFRSYVTNASIADPNSERVIILQYGGGAINASRIEGYGTLVRINDSFVLKCDRALVFPID